MQLRDSPFDVAIGVFWYVLRERDAMGVVGVACDATIGAVCLAEGWEQRLVRDAPSLPRPEVSPEAACAAISTELGRLLAGQALREKRRFEIRDLGAARLVGYPYWVAYRERRGHYGFDLLDAITAKVQRGGARRAFIDVLKSEP